MATPDLKDNKVTLAQGIGFAITILLFTLGGWVSMNSRVAVIESKQIDFDEGKKILFQMQSDMSEIKVSLKYIEQKQRDNTKFLETRESK